MVLMVTRADAEKEAAEMAGIPNKEFILMTKFTPVPFVEDILKKEIIVYDKNSILWRYDSVEGIWKPNAEQYIKTHIRKNLLGDEQQKRNYVEEIVAHLKDVTHDDTFEMDNNPFLIGFENGVYDLKEEKFLSFSPKFRLTNKLRIKIDENIQDCPAIDNFFEESVGEEFKDILYDLCAYCLFRRYPYPKLFFIHGPANTGKSKFIELLEYFLGKENRCSVEPQDIQKDIHATAQMEYKLANIASDINYDALDNINQVKKITGEDSVKVRNMYKEPRNTRLYAKQIFSTNKLPIVKEKTRAWYKRVYTIEFSNIVTRDKEDPFLIEKITSEKEIQGLAFIALKRLAEMKRRNFVFEHDIDQFEMQKVYEQLSNPIMMFIEQTAKVDRNEYIYQYEFKDRLKTWLQANHFAPVSNTEINEYMREHYTNSNRKSFNGDKTYRVWAGLRWRNKDDINGLNQFNHFNQVSKKVYIVRSCFTTPVKTVKLVN